MATGCQGNGIPSAHRTAWLAGRAFLPAAFIIAVVPFLLLSYRFNWLVDDAFISFRYAKHLAQGQGLRFNPGESPPVEGYSNLLWVLVLAPFERLGVSVPIASRVLSMACGVVLIWRLARFLRIGLNLPFWPVIVASVFFAALPPVAVWSTGGLETMPFTLFVFLTYTTLLGDPKAPRMPAACAACVLLLLTRVDGMIWVIGMLVLAALKAAARRDTRSIRPLLVCAGIVAIVLAGLTVFRLAYFGWPLPNTVYAKVGLCAMTLERGAKYVLNLLLVFPHFAAILIAGAAMVIRQGRNRTGALEVLLLGLGGVAYPAIAGGDWMPMGRLLVPAMPFLAVFLGMLLARVKDRPWVMAGCSLAAIALSLLPAYGVHVAPRVWLASLQFPDKNASFSPEYERCFSHWHQTEQRIVLGHALARYTRPGESLVVPVIGAVAYYTDLFIYDNAGLVNLEVAHRQAPRERFWAGHDKIVDPVFFVKYRPTYFFAMLVEVPADRRLDVAPGQWIRFKGDLPLDYFPPEAKAIYEPVGCRISETGDPGPAKLLVIFVQRDSRLYPATASVRSAQ